MAQEYFPWQANTTSELPRMYPMEVTAGNVSSTSPLVLNGSNQAVGTSYETLWEEGGVYVFPSAASTMTLSSDDANDTSAGTGARTVLIAGLDSNYNEISETVTLNGTTAVTTTNEWFRINNMRVASAGTGKTNAGSLFLGTGTVTAGKPANVFAEIYIGDGVTHEGLYSVAASTTLHILEIELGIQSNKDAQVQIVTTTSTGVQVVEVEFEINSTFSIDTLGMLSFPEKTDIEVRAKVSAGSTDMKILGLAILRQES